MICLSRMAAARPAGPAPTITTSNSIASRAGRSRAHGLLRLAPPNSSTFAQRVSAIAPLASASDVHNCGHDLAEQKPARELLDFYREPASMRSSARSRSTALPTTDDRPAPAAPAPLPDRQRHPRLSRL